MLENFVQINASRIFNMYSSQIIIFIYYIYIFIHIYMCVCVCVYNKKIKAENTQINNKLKK